MRLIVVVVAVAVVVALLLLLASTVALLLALVVLLLLLLVTGIAKGIATQCTETGTNGGTFQATAALVANDATDGSTAQCAKH
jgi:hypothetical protein